MMKSRFNTYNNGVLQICEAPNTVSDFNAVKNVTAASDLTVLYSLRYAEMSKREKDMQFAESLGKSLDLKVKTPYIKDVSTSHRVLIGKGLYSIYQTDYSADKTTLFLYLEKERDVS